MSSVSRALSSRRVRVRYVVAAGAALVVTVGAVTWVIDRPVSEAEGLVSEFVTALNDRDVDAAAKLTSYPSAAAASLTQMFDGLAADGQGNGDFDLTQYIDLDKDAGFFTIASDWNFGDGKNWEYTTQGSTKNLSVGWRIAWEPATVVPDLASGGTVRYQRTDAAPPLVFDAANNVLMSERTINAIELDPARITDVATTTQQLADVIDVVAPLITPESMMADLAAAGGKSITAVTLRDDDFAVLEDDLRAIAGVVVSPQPKLIVDDRRITSPVLDALRGAWQQGRDATAGWAVEVTGADGIPQRRTGFQGPAGPDLHATLDPRVQLAAEEAVVSAGTSASIVAVSASTGAVVGTAQNSYANDQGPIAFTGLYPGGTAAELVAAAQGPDQSLQDAAASLGVGFHYAMPGLDAFTGATAASRSEIDNFVKVPGNPSGPAEMTVTPFGLAQMAAAISRGQAPVPSIVQGQTAVADREAPAIDGAALNRLQGMLRDSAHDAGLSAYDGVTGFSGQSGDDRWFLGSQGDMAFSVYIENADDDDQAGRMVAKLLSEMK